jgi:hypothetical protein
MKHYLILQFKMANRQMEDFGLHPVAGYFLTPLVFLGLSFYLFYKTDFAPWIYALAALSFVSRWSETRRNEFLRTCFPEKAYRGIRLLENVTTAFSFVLFLFFKSQFLPALILLAGAALLAVFRFRSAFAFTMPTPFSKRPFEFTVGFRSTFLMFPFAWFLTIMAVSAGNFNLGVFSLLLVFLVPLSYYLSPENEFFIWIFNTSGRLFLWEKIKTALLYSTLPAIPVLAALAVFWPGYIHILPLFLLLGYLALITVILAKYASYPRQIDLPQVVLMGLCVYMPYLLIGVIPYFYSLAIRRLKEYL